MVRATVVPLPEERPLRTSSRARSENAVAGRPHALAVHRVNAGGETARRSRQDALVERLVLARHPERRPALAGPGAAARAVEAPDLADPPRHLRYVADDEPRDAIFDDLGHAAAREPDDGRSHEHRLDHHETEGLLPVDGEE